MAAAPILTIAGGLLDANAQWQAGKSRKKMAEFNAKLADMKAADALSRGEIDAADSGLRVRRTLGAQRAILAAQGIEVTSGSAANLQADTAAAGDAEQRTIRSNAFREAWGYKMAALDDRIGGQIAQREGQSAAVGTILSSGARAADQYSSSRRG